MITDIYWFTLPPYYGPQPTGKISQTEIDWLTKKDKIMKCRDFVYWLQGYFEILEAEYNPKKTPRLNEQQIEMIQYHLHVVFRTDSDLHSPNDVIHVGNSCSTLIGGMEEWYQEANTC